RNTFPAAVRRSRPFVSRRKLRGRGGLLDLGTGHFLLFDNIRFDLQILDDELLALRGVFAHIEGEEILDRLRARRHFNGSEPDVFPYEVLELIGGDFPEALESG